MIKLEWALALAGDSVTHIGRAGGFIYTIEPGSRRPHRLNRQRPGPGGPLFFDSFDTIADAMQGAQDNLDTFAIVPATAPASSDTDPLPAYYDRGDHHPDENSELFKLIAHLTGWTSANDLEPEVQAFIESTQGPTIYKRQLLELIKQHHNAACGMRDDHHTPTMKDYYQGQAFALDALMEVIKGSGK